MRQNGNGALTLEDARTWIEETGLCLFLPRKQYSTSIAPSFVEAVAGQRSAAPDPKNIAAAEDLLVRLETEGVAVRLNLLGQPVEQPDFVVAAWVLPYVYALRGDRDWRRSPQLTGSRQVSQLAVQTYKELETGDANLAALTHALGQGVTEGAVLRAITELWQQLRIIPVVSGPSQPIEWQLLRQRFQKAIAEGASTSQVTAISVLASIYLQAVIAATMEDVELFLSPLTARSKIREVLRGLAATRQVHTVTLGHSAHYYVAGTLPEFETAPTVYASSSMPASAYFMRSSERDEDIPEPVSQLPIPVSVPTMAAVAAVPSMATPAAAPSPISQRQAAESHAPRTTAPRKPVSSGKPAAARPHFSRPAAHSRDRKPAQASSSNRTARRPGPEARTTGARPSTARPSSVARPSGARPSGSRPANGSRPASGPRDTKSSAPAWSQRSGHSNGSKPAGKPGATSRSGSLARNGSAPRKDSRPDARPAHSSRKPALAAGAKAGNSKRFGFTAPAKQGTKKRG